MAAGCEYEVGTAAAFIALFTVYDEKFLPC